jgi:hypothetical protein
MALPRDVDHAAVISDSTIHVGILDLNYGVSETLEVGTVWPLLLVGLPNTSLKWRAYEGRSFQVAIQGSIFHYDIQTRNPNSAPFTSTLLPLRLIATTRYRALTISGGFALTRVLTTGHYNAPSGEAADVLSLSDVRGSLNLSTGVFKTTVLWDYRSGFAWVFDAQLLLFQRAQAIADSTFQLELDERTSASGVIQGSGGGDLTANNTRNVSASALWYWSKLHIKVGLTVGDVMIPYLNVFLVDEAGTPISMMLPKLDVYYRF